MIKRWYSESSLMFKKAFQLLTDLVLPEENDQRDLKEEELIYKGLNSLLDFVFD